MAGPETSKGIVALQPLAICHAQGSNSLTPPPAGEQGEEVIEQVAEGGDERGDIGPTGGVEHFADSGHFFIGADKAHLREHAFGAG